MEYRRNNEYLNLVSPLKKRLGIRIIFNKKGEEYHRGSIKVSHSEIEKAPCKSKKKAS
jgi:hypothetical protein